MQTLVSFHTSYTLSKEIENIVESGYFRNKDEVINEALRLLIKKYKARKIAEDIDRIRNKFGKDINLTEEIIKAHEMPAQQ